MQNENYMAMHLQGFVNFEILEANLLTVVLFYSALPILHNISMSNDHKMI